MDAVSGIVLAGGQGRRMGGVDKGLQTLRGKPRFGHRVVPDAIGGFAGPLAGLHAGLSAASHALAVTVPCDSPFLPLDLVARLRAALGANDLAVARTLDQPHPVFSLVRRSVLDHLSRFLEGGGRKIDAWYATLKVIEVPFDDEADAFRNINTREELNGA
jgi:molybdopterin-guanine dinucleotide biosynthesis protein A